VDALLGEIRHVAHDILLEEQDEGGSGAGAIKGGSLIASSSTSQPKGRELHPHGRGKWLGNLPWWSFEKMSLVRTPYDIFKELAPGKFWLPLRMRARGQTLVLGGGCNRDTWMDALLDALSEEPTGTKGYFGRRSGCEREANL
jgi:hypothetical protein